MNHIIYIILLYPMISCYAQLTPPFHRCMTETAENLLRRSPWLVARPAADSSATQNRNQTRRHQNLQAARSCKKRTHMILVHHVTLLWCIITCMHTGIPSRSFAVNRIMIRLSKCTPAHTWQFLSSSFIYHSSSQVLKLCFLFPPRWKRCPHESEPFAEL